MLFLMSKRSSVSVRVHCCSKPNGLLFRLPVLGSGEYMRKNAIENVLAVSSDGLQLCLRRESLSVAEDEIGVHDHSAQVEHVDDLRTIGFLPSEDEGVRAHLRRFHLFRGVLAG